MSQATGTPSPRRSSEAGPSRTVTSPQHQDPYPQWSPLAASRTSQMSYKKTMFLVRARAMGKNLFRRRALPAHPKNDPPPTIHAPFPQLLPTASPDKEWASRLEETLPIQDTSCLASSLLGTDPQAQIQMLRAPTPPEDPHLSPITLGSNPSHTPKSPVPSP
ncbi:hypothetical protein ARMSODRAFT_1017320 [Armillaria solidipes]|uniref:Uncharacterized protein n=1 Tax=Armillaria solidipes TaxID=1076256 RepID=A0A2H3BKJ7_9AGAR|nr:hypothetical protein ARMSODRAFT_1017320 [Armillaria solidipes]